MQVYLYSSVSLHDDDDQPFQSIYFRFKFLHSPQSQNINAWFCHIIEYQKRVKGHLRQLCRMSPKWPLTLWCQRHTQYGPRLPPKVVSFTGFTIWRPLFELNTILRQVHRITPKWPWLLKGQRYIIHMLQLHGSPKLHFVLLYGQPFSCCRPFWDKCTEQPPNDLKH